MKSAVISNIEHFIGAHIEGSTQHCTNYKINDMGKRHCFASTPQYVWFYNLNKSNLILNIVIQQNKKILKTKNYAKKMEYKT